MKTKKAKYLEPNVIRLIKKISKMVNKKGKLLESERKLINQNWRLWLKCLQAKDEHPYLEDVVDIIGFMTALPVFKKYIPYLEKLLTHPNPDIRCNAIMALGVYNNDKHFKTFLKILKEDVENRWLICIELSHYEDEGYEKEIVDSMTWVIKKNDPVDQYTALQCIADWDNPKSFKAILWASKNAKNKECRELAKKLLLETEK